MGRRLELQALLETITPNVYYQPPANTEMQYPCIVYARDYVKKQHADNGPYKSQKRYQVTVIDRDPDSTLPDLVGELPSCNYERFFTAENLNHDIFKLFY